MKNMLSWITITSLAMATPLSAHEMSEQNFHVIRLQMDGTENNDGGLVTWDGEGWYGGDTDKFVGRTKGEMQNGHVEASELWGLWSHNISDFWDVQAGVRQDIDPHPTTSFALGVEGMLPQFLETHAHGFISTRGDVSARIEQSIDFAVTQRLILEPHAELNVYGSDVPELGIGSGISNIQAGAQLRYEVTRKFAPYVDLVYETTTGNTARIKQKNGEDTNDLTLRVGLRIAF